MATQTGWTNTATFEEKIDINAQAKQPYDILQDPSRLPEYMPEISNVQPVGTDSYKATYTVKAARIVPLSFSLTYHVSIDQYLSQVTLYFDGNIEGTLCWNLEPQGNGTRATATANYKFARKIIDDTVRDNVPGGKGPLGDLVGKAVSGLDLALEGVMTRSREDVRNALKNLKAMSER